MQCLQGWVVKTHPLQVYRITLHPRGYEVMQLMQFGRLRPLRLGVFWASICPLLLEGLLALVGDFAAPALLLDELFAL